MARNQRNIYQKKALQFRKIKKLYLVTHCILLWLSKKNVQTSSSIMLVLNNTWRKLSIRRMLWLRLRSFEANSLTGGPRECLLLRNSCHLFYKVLFLNVFQTSCHSPRNSKTSLLRGLKKTYRKKFFKILR